MVNEKIPKNLIISAKTERVSVIHVLSLESTWPKLIHSAVLH